MLAESLCELPGRTIQIQNKPRCDRARYLKLASINTGTALASKLAQQLTFYKRLAELKKVINLCEINRM